MDMRQHAQRYIGQPIIAHHVNGTVHRGILHSVTNEGMYIRRTGSGAGYASSDEVESSFTHVDHPELEGTDAESVFFGLGFLPWLALSGFWGGGFWW